MIGFCKLCGIAALVFLSSCETYAPYAARPIENDAELVSNVVITDAELNEMIRIGVASVRRVETTNQLKVIVPIRNIGFETLQVRVQVSFLDLQRRPTGDDTNAQVVIIAPGMTDNFSVTSRGREAMDWTMRIMPNSRG